MCDIRTKLPLLDTVPSGDGGASCCSGWRNGSAGVPQTILISGWAPWCQPG